MRGEGRGGEGRLGASDWLGGRLFLSLFHRHHYFNPPNCILYRGDVIFKYFYFAKGFIHWYYCSLITDCFLVGLFLLLIDLYLYPLRLLYTRGCVCGYLRY